MFEADHETTVRVRAPITGVWEELCSIDRLLARIPEIAYFKVEPDGQRARISTRLAWGPVRWKVGTAGLLEATPPHRLHWGCRAPSLEVDFEGTFELTRAGTEDETDLFYRGYLRCNHTLIRRLRGALTSVLESHVNRFPPRIATLAAQHAEAEQHLHHRPAPKTQ
jgi:hypothetical protein